MPQAKQHDPTVLMANEVKKAKASWSVQNKKRKDNTKDAYMMSIDSNNESINPNNKATVELSELQPKIIGSDLDDLKLYLERN